MMLFQCSRSFGHLHQGNNALLHSRAAGAGEKDHRKLFLRGALHGSRDLFTHVVAHAAHQKSRIADTDNGLLSVDRA